MTRVAGKSGEPEINYGQFLCFWVSLSLYYYLREVPKHSHRLKIVHLAPLAVGFTPLKKKMGVSPEIALFPCVLPSDATT